MKKILVVLIYLAVVSCNNDKIKADYLALEKELQETKKELNSVKNAKDDSPGLIHTVYFWLKEDLSQEDEAAFLKGLKSLKSIDAVKGMHIGPPAPTEAREVVDNSFSYAASYYFDDIDGQNAYQVDPIHVKFAEDIQGKIIKVIVYDHVVSE